MKRLIVLVPEGLFMEYFVYDLPEIRTTCRDCHPEYQRGGRMRFRGSGASLASIKGTIEGYSPDSVAVRVRYGGSRFKDVSVYDRSLLPELEKLIPISPLDLPPVIKLLKTLDRVVPPPQILLFFETSFFSNLPVQERIYAIDGILSGSRVPQPDQYRKFGYHGLYHEAAVIGIRKRNPDVRKIVSICLDSVPELAAINAGRPVMVSSGSTPLEGLPGDRTCGDIDPGVVLFLEQRSGPEMVNEILTRRSGLSAMSGKTVTLDDVFEDEITNREASDLFKYRVLLECGSAIALMGGLDAVVFSGKYIQSAEKLSGWLTSKLSGHGVSGSRIPQEVPDIEESRIPVFYSRDPLDRIIAERCLEMDVSAVGY